jgi:phosphate-selective porin OprO/OprP
MESSLPANAFAPFRNDGVAIRSNAFNQRMEWEAGVFMDTDSYGKTTSSKPNFTGRLTFLPYYEEEGKKLLHLGGSYSLRNPKGTLRYSTYPEAHLMPNFVDTGKFNSERANLFGVESAFIFGPLFLQGEYIANAIESINDSPDLYFNGFYAQASYFLTGEYKPYDKITGTFGRVQPKNNFSLRGKSWGAWEIAGRYSYVDLNDESVNGGTLSDITLGLNWYWNPNMRVMLNYIHSYLKDTGDADIVQTRFQADF